MDSIRLPTHEEVASILEDSHPDIASFIRTCDQKRNCWGDMLFKAQIDFEPHYLATALNRLYMKGWGQLIVITWCPVTQPMIKLYEKAHKLVDEFKDMEDYDKKMRKYTVYGTFALIRDLWKQTRNEWMKKWSLRSDNDPIFFNCIIMYLEKLHEEIYHASNNG